MKTYIRGMLVMLATLVVVMLAAAPAQATIYVDFYNNATDANDTGSQRYDSVKDRYWNVTERLTVGSALTDMVDEDNTATLVDLNLLVAGMGWVASGVANSALVDWGAAVTGNGMMVGTGGSAQYRIEGLEAGRGYDLTFYGARNVFPDPGTRTAEITIGTTTQLYKSYGEGMTTFSGVIADSNGYITFTFGGEGGTESAHLSGMSIGLTPPPLQATVYVDFMSFLVHDDPGSGHPGYDASQNRHWNVTDRLAAGMALVNMVDQDYTATPADLNLLSASGWGPVNSGAGSTLVDWGNDVTLDGAYVSGTGAYAQYRIEGLEAGRGYDLTFYGARGLTDIGGRTAEVTIGTTTQSYESEDEGMTTFSGVIADSNGYITFTFAGEGSEPAHLSGMSIGPTPEPPQAMVYVDFNSLYAHNDAGSGNPGYDAAQGRHWNVTDQNTAGMALTDMVDEDYVTTSVDLDLLSVSVAGGYNLLGLGMTASSLVDWGDDVTQDCLYINPGVSVQYRIEGLEAGRGYDLTFYGSRNVSPETGGRTALVTIGATTQSYESLYQGKTVFEGVIADSSGYITFTFHGEGDTENAHLSGMSIYPVPPPKGTVIILR